MRIKRRFTFMARETGSVCRQRVQNAVHSHFVPARPEMPFHNKLKQVWRGCGALPYNPLTMKVGQQVGSTATLLRTNASLALSDWSQGDKHQSHKANTNYLLKCTNLVDEVKR